jgi:hypothetical protein
MRSRRLGSPGRLMQLDLGHRRVPIGGCLVVVHLVAEVCRKRARMRAAWAALLASPAPALEAFEHRFGCGSPHVVALFRRSQGPWCDAHDSRPCGETVVMTSTLQAQQQNPQALRAVHRRLSRREHLREAPSCPPVEYLPRID